MPALVWALTAALTLLFVSAIVAAPLALYGGHDTSALIIYRSFGRLCHQLPGRSFYAAGHPFAVCARCTGIYFGFAAAVLAYPLLRRPLRRAAAPERKWLLLALAPAAADFALDLLGVWSNTHLSRSVTGAILGVAAAFYVVPGLIDMFRLISERASHE